MLSLYIISGILGVMLFFTVAVAPTIFKVLPQEWAGIYVRQFFPKYYLVLGIFCLIAGILAELLLLKIIAFNCAALFAISLWLLTPAINKAKDLNNIKKFNLLHYVSVAINFIILILLFYCFWIK
jgi:hypothetical protein